MPVLDMVASAGTDSLSRHEVEDSGLVLIAANVTGELAPGDTPALHKSVSYLLFGSSGPAHVSQGGRLHASPPSGSFVHCLD